MPTPRCYATRTLLLLIAASIMGCTEPQPSQAPPQADLVITNVQVIDAVSGAMGAKHVTVLGDEIIALTPPTEPAPSATQQIDGTGQYLIPGLWDMHVHITYEPQLTRHMPALFLDYGITSVRDTGGMLPLLRPEILRWRSDETDAPRIFFSGPLLDGARVVYDGNDRPQIGIANPTPEQAQASVEDLVNAGADFIKIYELVPPEVFNALVSAAGVYRLPIAAHVPLSLDAAEAGPRVNSMEHLRNIELACAEDSDELLQARKGMIRQPGDLSGHALRSQMHTRFRTTALASASVDSERCRRVIDALKNTIQVPTLRLNTITRYSPLDRNDWQQHLARLPESVANRWQSTAQSFYGQANELSLKMAQWSLDLTGAMHSAGVPIGAGTDTPIGQAIPGYSLHTELERLVAAGLTPREALHSATIRPAEFFGLQQSYGQIQPGMVADLVLLDADPLQDITHTRAIKAVIAQGRVVR